mmetsp:Transcript_22657/g.31611  ORF Transcript_22657/g.31611 Transcript_22657/m.31611 type:complete len:116 (+) Transcript_22657:255-602(+)
MEYHSLRHRVASPIDTPEDFSADDPLNEWPDDPNDWHKANKKFRSAAKIRNSQIAINRKNNPNPGEGSWLTLIPLLLPILILVATIPGIFWREYHFLDYFQKIMLQDEDELFGFK